MKRHTYSSLRESKPYEQSKVTPRCKWRFTPYSPFILFFDFQRRKFQLKRKNIFVAFISNSHNFKERIWFWRKRSSFFELNAQNTVKLPNDITKIDFK